MRLIFRRQLSLIVDTTLNRFLQRIVKRPEKGQYFSKRGIEIYLEENLLALVLKLCKKLSKRIERFVKKYIDLKYRSIL